MEQAFIVFLTRQFDQLTAFFEGFFQVTNGKDYLLKIGAFFTKGLGIFRLFPDRGDTQF